MYICPLNVHIFLIYFYYCGIIRQQIAPSRQKNNDGSNIVGSHDINACCFAPSTFIDRSFSGSSVDFFNDTRNLVQVINYFNISINYILLHFSIV